MKKVKTWFIVLITALFMFSGCETEPPTPDCELQNYGSVTVNNDTGYKIYTDVTWGNVVTNNEVRLSHGSSYKYTKIPAGSIEIWVSFDGYDWDYQIEYLSACEDMSYRWYLKSAEIKSTEIESMEFDRNNLALEISMNGEVIKTVTTFERKLKE